MPIDQEHETHRLTHIPSLPWSTSCATDRRKVGLHVRMEDRTDALVPVIQADQIEQRCGVIAHSTLVGVACNGALLFLQRGKLSGLQIWL